MTFTLGAPQIIWFCLAVFNIVYTGVNNGKPQGKYNVWTSLVGVAVAFALLCWGGFFS